MESPFAKYGEGCGGGTFVLYLEPILNPYYRTYQNVITLDRMPTGPLADMVGLIQLPKLSPFQEAGVFSSPNYGRGLLGGSCVYVLLRYPKCVGGFNWKITDAFMGADDIPSVLGYLKANGYTIDMELTKMMLKSKIDVGGVSERRFSGNRKVICFVN
jgi:hypothetical protein